MCKRTSHCITGLLLLSPIFTHAALASMLPSAAMSYQQNFNTANNFRSKSGIQAQLSAPLDQQSKYHAFAALGSNPLQYRLGTRIYGDTKLDSEGFRVIGLYYDRIQLAHGLTKKTGWQASFDITQSGPQNTLSLYAYYPQYLTDSASSYTMNNSDPSQGLMLSSYTHYTLPGAKIAYTRHIPIQKNLLIEPSLQYFHHIKHPQNNKTVGFHGAGLTFGLRSSWQKAALFASANASFDQLHKWQMGISLQIQSNLKEHGLQTKSLRMQRYPSEVWFGNQGFDGSSQSLYFNGHPISSYHVIDSGSWAELKAVTTNGKPNSFIVVNADINYTPGQNDGCADIMLADGSTAAGNIFRVYQNDGSAISSQALTCDDRSTIVLQPGQSIVGGGTDVVFTDPQQTSAITITTPGSKATIRNDSLKGGITFTEIETYTVYTSSAGYWTHNSGIIEVGDTNYIAGLDLTMNQTSNSSAIVSHSTNTGTGPIQIQNINITATGTLPYNKGIYVQGNASVNIAGNNTITTSSNNSSGIEAGMVSSNSSVNIAGNNTITTSGSNSRGINLQSLASSNIAGNNTITTFGQSSHGIYVKNTPVNISGDHDIRINTSSSNSSYGIFLYSSTANISSKNHINTTAQASFGIYLLSSSSATISGENDIFTADSNARAITMNQGTNELSLLASAKIVTDDALSTGFGSNSIDIAAGAQLQLENDSEPKSCTTSRIITGESREIDEFSDWCS